MNTMVKGAGICAAGVTLLMSGFGTYALWSDGAGTDAPSVTSGGLRISAGAASWQDVSAVGPNTWTPGSLIVPGDTLTMTQTFQVTATGANMRGRLTFSPGTADTSAFGNHLTVTASASADTALTPSTSTPGRAWTFDAPLGTKSVTATVTFAFDSATTQQEAQNAAAGISASTFSLTQVRP